MSMVGIEWAASASMYRASEAFLSFVPVLVQS